MSYEKVAITDEEGSGDHDQIPVNDVELVELKEIDANEYESTFKVEVLETPKPAHRPGIGLVFMFFSTVFFSVMSLLVKIMGSELPSFQLVFARSFIQGIVVFIVLVSMKVSPWGQPQYRVYFLARGVAGFLSLSCFYYSLIALPLNEATVLSFTSPIFTAIWGVVILKERWEKVDIFGAILSFIGVILIARPFAFMQNGGESSSGGNSFERLFAVCIAVVGAVFAGLAYVTVRKLGDKVNALVFVFWFSIVCCTLSPFAMFFQDFVIPAKMTWLPLVGMALSATVGQGLLNRGLQLEKAAKASAMNYLQIVFSFLWNWLFLKEEISPYSIAGSTLITAWTIVIAYKYWRASRKLVK